MEACMPPAGCREGRLRLVLGRRLVAVVVANGDIELVHKRQAKVFRRVLQAEVEGKPVGLVRAKLLVNGDFDRLALRSSVRQAYVVRRR